MSPTMTDRGAPPPYALVARARNFNLRPVVLALSTLIGLVSLMWAFEFFEEVSDDKNEGLTKLTLILEIFYIVSAAINFFGTAATASRRFVFIRSYSYGVILSSLLLVGAYFIRVIARIVYQDDLVNECVKEATGQGADLRWGGWRLHVAETLSEYQATDWCNNASDHKFVSEIYSTVASISSLGLVSFIVWSYAHSSSLPAQSSSRRPNPYYTPPYTDDPYVAGRATDYAPLAGPPPGFAPAKESSDELPGYDVGMKGGKFNNVVERGGSLSKDSFDDAFADYDERGR